MKFVILLAIIGFVAVSAAPTKEELIKRATALESALEKDIERVRTAHPIEAKVLEVERRELKVLSGELATAKLSAVVAILEIRLSAVERRVIETLHRIDGRTGRPTEVPTTSASSL